MTEAAAPRTLRGFYRALAATRQRWYLSNEGQIRFRSSRPVACPLTAVYGGWETTPLDPKGVASLVMLAADDNCWKGERPAKRRRVRRIRRRLLAICRLKEPKRDR